jgi:pyrroline-5-carboxylate reductase
MIRTSGASIVQSLSRVAHFHQRRKIMFQDSHVGFLGGGNMGEALIKGLLTTSLLNPEQIHVFDVLAVRMRYLEETYKVQLASNPRELCRRCEVILLAVKPQNISDVLKEIHPHLGHRPLVISIAAGISLLTLVESLPEGVPIIRVMPNAPALVLQGSSALSRGPSVTDEVMEKALGLFGSVGRAIEVEEKWMDAVTGLSGSGPAYVLLMLESLIDAGVLMGIPRPIAREVVVQTVLGTTTMVQETGKHPGELKDMITSPGGTTINGLHILEQRGVRGAFMEAVKAATLRSVQLGKA